MKAILIIFLALSNVASASVDAKAFQAEVLFRRIKEIIDVRSLAMNKCSSKKSLEDFNGMKQELEADNFSHYLNKLDLSIEALNLSTQEPECQGEIASADLALKKLQREKFTTIEKMIASICFLATPYVYQKCRAKVTSVINDLDPFCVTQGTKNINGVEDSNPCMAGDRLLGKIMRRKDDPRQSQVASFLRALETQLQDASSESAIDLWTIFSQDKLDNDVERKRFLGMLVMVNYLGTAGGYVDGPSDEFWQSALRDKKMGEDIFNEFYSLRNKVNWFKHLLGIIKDKNIVLTIKSFSLENFNHHNFMAMFLA